jgi:hypothetical protein
MATKTIGTHQINQPDLDVAVKLNKLIGKNFPVRTTYANGQVIGVSYDTEWLEGTTEPVENKDGTIKNKPNHKKQKLTASEIKQVDKWLKDNIKV